MDTAPDFIPDDQFVSDQKQSAAPDFISDKDFKSDDAKTSAPDFVPDDKFTPDEHYQTMGQQALTGLEGVGRGLIPGADALAVGMRKAASYMGVPDEQLHWVAPDPEDVVRREKANPIESTAGELAGNLALMSKLPQIGGKAIDGMIKMGLISSGEELGKAMLGQGDPATAVAAHIAGSSALGLVTGGLFGKLEKVGPKFIAGEKVGTKLNSFLAGLGYSASKAGGPITSLAEAGLPPEKAAKVSEMAFKAGQVAYKSLGTAATSYVGYKLTEDDNNWKSGVVGSLAGPLVGRYINKLMAPYITKVSKDVIYPMILKMASTGKVQHLTQALDHAELMSKGSKLISGSLNNLFSAGGNEAIHISSSEKERDKLKDYIDNGGIDTDIQDHAQAEGLPQQFAKGGAVDEIQQPNAIAHYWPEQNILLNTAKGRISGYLNSVKPSPMKNKLPYDNHHKNPLEDRDYNKILDLANQPLSILNKIKKGDLTPKDMKHFTSMYPDLYSHLSKKINEKMVNHEMDESKKPPYRTRQALSLFLGTSLDTSLTPQSIQAAQMVFAQQKASSPAVKSNTGLETIGKSAMTAEQSRTQKLNKN